jgi:DnaJ-class molecular chaperone
VIFEGAEVPPCPACEDKGPHPGSIWCEPCGGEGFSSEFVRGYRCFEVRCEHCHGRRSFVCSECEGTGEAPETKEEEEAA